MTGVKSATANSTAQNGSVEVLRGAIVTLIHEHGGGRAEYHCKLTESVVLNGDILVSWPLDDAKHPIALDPEQPLFAEIPAQFDALYGATMQVAPHQPRRNKTLSLVASGPWQRIQRRQHVRWPVRIVPKLAGSADDQDRRKPSVVIIDVSAGGIGIQSTNALLPKQVVNVEFTLPGDTRPLAVRATVERIKRATLDGTPIWEAGCRFENMRENDRDRIVKFIFNEQRRLAQSGKR
jgi:hypothetical protein